MNWIKKAWKEIEIKPRTVKEFGFILTGFFFLGPLLANAIRVFLAHQQFHYWFGWPILGLLAFLVNLFLPQMMAFLYHFAMLAAQGISWVMMRIVLGIMFYFVLTTISVIARLLGKDILDQNVDKNAVTYWKKHVSRPAPERYERLF